MTRIGFISDLHIDYLRSYRPAEMIEELVHSAQDNALSHLIIGGDISNSYTMTLTFIEQLQQSLSPIKLYFIPGNHDYWQDPNASKETWKIHQLYQTHPLSLMNEPLLIGDRLAIIGHMGWYNHAYYNQEKFSPEQIEIGRYKIATWQDKKRLDWQMTDEEVSQIFAAEIKEQFNQVSERQVILVTHVVTTKDFIIPMPHRAFDFFNAFIATDDLEPWMNNSSISHHIMGHVHIRHQFHKNHQQWITNSLGYEKEWRTNQLSQELAQSLYVFNFESSN
ncbi:metallophosphoesterase [Aerococcaceae bacterium DSM 111020]|nr:metallophosphoesterase [Aerococcaceae bacterium DSM 111020]